MPEFHLSKGAVQEKSVRMASADTLGMDLGELRAAVTAAADLDDKSVITFSKIKDSIVEGEFFAGVINIRERSAVV